MAADEGPHRSRGRGWRGCSDRRAVGFVRQLGGRAQRSTPAAPSGKLSGSALPHHSPSYASVNLVSVRATCNRALGRAACLDRLASRPAPREATPPTVSRRGSTRTARGCSSRRRWRCAARLRSPRPLRRPRRSTAAPPPARAARRFARRGSPVRPGNAFRSATPPARRQRSAIATAPASPPPFPPRRSERLCPGARRSGLPIRVQYSPHGSRG